MLAVTFRFRNRFVGGMVILLYRILDLALIPYKQLKTVTGKGLNHFFADGKDILGVFRAVKAMFQITE